jgi:hypothetical protein
MNTVPSSFIKNRELLADSLLADIEFWSQEIAPNNKHDEAITEACGILTNAGIDAVERLHRDNANQGKMIAELIGTKNPAITSQYIDLPVNLLLQMSKALTHCPSNRTIIVQRYGGLYKIFSQKADKSMKLLGTFHND